MAVMIALSVALLPMAGSVASVVNSASQSSAAGTKGMAMDEAMASDMAGAMDECCPDRAKPCDQPSGHCTMACCCAAPLNLASTIAYRLDIPPFAGQLLPIPVDQTVALHSGRPPFRPPRV